MKLKDIENKLKAEHAKKDIPDVYARAKKAPLNKLLSGETPASAFPKQTVMRALILTLALFLVVAISVSAIMLSGIDGGKEPMVYVSISIGDDARYGVVMSGSYSVLSVTVEKQNGIVLEHPMTTYSSQIAGFISPNAGDKVRICAICEDGSAAQTAERYVKESLVSEGKVEVDDIEQSVSSAAVVAELKAYIIAHGGTLEGNANLSQVIAAYMNLVA